MAGSRNYFAKTTSSLPALPVEMYRCITEFVLHPKDLSALCRTSCTLRHQAERVLYCQVKIKEESIPLFCSTVIQYPRLGTLVRTLRLSLSTDTVSSYQAQAASAIAMSLWSLVHLQELELLGSAWPSIFSDWPILFSQCQLPLQTFISSMAVDSQLLAFLKSQWSIQHWGTVSDPMSSEFVEIPADALPNMVSSSIDASASSINRLFEGQRHFTHIRVKFPGFALPLPKMLFGQKTVSITLQPLFLGGGAASTEDTWDSVCGIIKQSSPNVRHLEFWTVKFGYDIQMSELMAVAAKSLGKLKIETLVFIGYYSTDCALQGAKEILRSMMKQMKEWPSLRRIVVYDDDTKSFSLTKIPFKNDIVICHGTHYDGEAWRRV